LMSWWGQGCTRAEAPPSGQR